MRRTVACLVSVAAITAACSRVPTPQGPAQLQSQGALVLDDMRLAGQARSAALAFLRAYAAAATDNGRKLRPLLEGVLAREWAHWLAIQNAGFPGGISGQLQLGHLGHALPVRAADGSLDNLVAYGVEVRATVAFTLTDDAGDPLPPLRRIMDGLIVLVQGQDRAMRVLNFSRDGRRLDQFFQVFDGAREQRGGVTVEIRNLVQLERWQFGVEITNGTGRPVHVLPKLTALLTAAEAPATEQQPLVTFSGPIMPGKSAEGIVSFDLPSETDGLDLQIAVAGPDGDTTGFVFGVPQPAGTAGGSQTPSP
jgi:hypothetical protein